MGDVYTNPARWGGLTSFGADVIKECNKLGILVDLTHCSNDTIDAALKIATQPVIISHTGLDTQLGQNEFMAKMMRPRLISKQQAKIVADAGGVVGVWTHLSDTPLAYAQNIRAFKDVIGVEHLCIGTDTKMTTSYRPPGNSGGPPPGSPGPQQGGDTTHYINDSSQRNKQNRTGGGPNQNRPGERTNESWQNQKDGFYCNVVDAMLKTGFTEDEIGKVGGGNFCRIFKVVTGTR